MLVERAGKDGWAVAGDAGVTVALDTAVDDELAREGRVYELIHRVNSMRKDAGLELTDRITLTLPAADADLLEHADWIARETLADRVECGDARCRRSCGGRGCRSDDAGAIDPQPVGGSAGVA